MSTITTTLLATTLFLLQTNAQPNGEALYKTRCSTCHALDRDNTGPALPGVKKKWEEAGESNLLYEWVSDSKKLIGSNKSRMAGAIKGFNAIDMPPQQLTHEEIDAIFAYTDAPVMIHTGPEEIVAELIGPDYAGNLILFYWLFGFLVFLLVIVLIMANTILAFLRSELFRDRLKEEQLKGKKRFSRVLTILVIGFLLFGNQTYALDFTEAGSTTEKTPWLLVEAIDLYLLLAIDVALVIVVLYLKSLFNGLVKMIQHS